MDVRNTIFGWVLGAGIVALGATSLTGIIFKAERPEVMGYMPEGVAEEGVAEGPPLEALLAQADLAAGEATFGKCVACHTINAGGANGIGPNLHGIMGLPIGSHAAGFSYSPALSGHGGNWDWTNMDAWLASPRRFANGTIMSFAGISNPQERANLIAYLNSQGSNLPLPATPAAEAPTESEAAAEGEGEAAAPAAEGAAPAAATAPTAAPAN
jgi:cytochrome c